MTTHSFKQIQTYLDKNLGLHYSEDRKYDLEKSLHAISGQAGFQSVDEFVQSLTDNGNADAIALLAKHLTIGETYFFREPMVLDYFNTKLLPALVLRASKRETPLTIWSAGCCTGEEIYSVAMLIHNSMNNLPKLPVNLIGTDINPDFLIKAKSGVYRDWSFRNDVNNFKQKYFTSSRQSSFLLHDNIKEMVSFSMLNLISDDYQSTLNISGKIDVIFCRNVLIYFSDENRKHIIGKFYDMLDDDGYLILSLTEVAHQPDTRLQQIIEDGIIIFKKKHINKATEIQNQVSKAQLSLPSREKPGVPRTQFSTTSASGKKLPGTELKQVNAGGQKGETEIPAPNIDDLYIAGEYPMVIRVIKEQLKYREKFEKLSFKDKEIIFARFARSYASTGNIEKAIEITAEGIKLLPDSGRLHYIYGHFQSANGSNSSALTYYRRALFLSPAYPAALFASAVIYRQKGETAEYIKTLENLLRVSQKLPGSQEIEEMDGLTAGGLKNLVESILQSQKM